MGLFDDLDPRKRAEKARKEAERAARALRRQRNEIEAQTGVALPDTPAETLVTATTSVVDGKSIDEALKEAGRQVATDVRKAVNINQIPDRIAIEIGEQALGDVGRILVQTVHGPKMLSELIAVDVLDQMVGSTQEGFSPEFLGSPQGKTAVALAVGITWSRDYYLSLKGTVPLPSSVKDLMKNGFSMTLLDSVRIVQSDSFDLALPGTINMGQKFFSGHEHAVTLDNVIVFSEIPDADGEQLEWWAHELHHVKQYGKWGIAGFAKRYVEDWDRVETEADEEARKVVVLIKRMEQFRLEQV